MDYSSEAFNRIGAITSGPSTPPRGFAPQYMVAMVLAGANFGIVGNAMAQPVAVEEAKPGAQFTLGAAAAYMPRYEGSDEYKVRALPLISYRYGRFFAGALGGIGYNFSPLSNVEFGPLLSYRFGRDESDSARLHGLGDIDAGADLGAYVRWNLQPFVVHATLKHGIGGDVTGTQLKLGAGYASALGPSDRLALDTSLEWADTEVMQAYFGVTAAQSANSGLAAYTAGSGIRRYGVGAIWTHTYTPQWFSTVGIGAYRLGNEAANSPITVDRNAGTASAGIGYRF